MSYRVDPHLDMPPSRQLVGAVLDALARGELAAGDRLPSVRGMASEALINPNTVVKAYKELEVMGVAEGRNGSGVYVTARGPELAVDNRRARSLEMLDRALEECLLAGHDVARIKIELKRCLTAETAKNGKGVQ